MAAVLKQHNSADLASATSGSISFGGATTPGNLITVCVRVGGTSTAAITDDASGGSNNYGNGPGLTNSDVGLFHSVFGTCYIFSTSNCKAATQISYTLTGGAATVRITIEEWAGVQIGSPLDKTSSNYTVTNTASPHNSGNTATTTLEDELLVGFNGNNFPGTYTAGTSQSYALADVAPAAPNSRAATEYVSVTAKAAYQADFSLSTWPNAGNGDSISLIATYKLGVTFDAASNSAFQLAAATYNWNHTVTGSNTFLAVDIELLSVAGTTVQSVTFNGVALSLIGVQSSVTGADRVECWGLINPASGTHVIAVTLSASISSVGTAVSYRGVDQTTATESFNSNQGTNIGAANATVTITPVVNNTLIHAACASTDTAIVAGQTSRNNVTGAAGSGANEDTSPISPAAGTVMTYSVGAAKTWAIAGYAIRPTGAGGDVLVGLLNPFPGPRVTIFA